MMTFRTIHKKNSFFLRNNRQPTNRKICPPSSSSTNHTLLSCQLYSNFLFFRRYGWSKSIYHDWKRGVPEGAIDQRKNMYTSCLQMDEAPPLSIGSNVEDKGKCNDNNENGEEFTYITVEPLHSPTPQNDDPSLVIASIEAESTNFDKILSKNNWHSFSNLKIPDNEWLEKNARWGVCTVGTNKEDVQEIKNTWVWPEIGSHLLL